MASASVTAILLAASMAMPAGGLRQSWELKKPLIVLAGHHKVANELTERMASTKTSVKTFGAPLDMSYSSPTGVRGCKGCVDGWKKQPQMKLVGKNIWASNLRVYRNFDLKALTEIQSSGRPYKIIHFIRDPLSLTLAAYLHHRKVDDAPRDMAKVTGPEKLAALSIREGVKAEAKAELSGTIAEMQEVLSNSLSDKNVLTIGVEDFMDDFYQAASCVYSFIRGDKPEDVSTLVAAAMNVSAGSPVPEMIGARPGVHNSRLQRDNQEMNIAEAAASVPAFEQNKIWHQIRLAQARLGYEEVDKKIFRYSQPRCHQFLVPE